MTLPTIDLTGSGDHWAQGAFEACPAFRPATDPGVCACGWLADDHVPSRPVRAGVTPIRPRPPRPATLPARRAS